MDETIQISGIVEEIIYMNEENGYTVFGVDSESDGLFTATGYTPFLTVGENVLLNGVWTTHSSYGEQFKVLFYEKILPADEQSILTYLSSGIISGIRENTAKKLLKHFGTDILNIMLTEPRRLAEIKGISMKKAEKIGKDFAEIQCQQSIIMFLQKYNVSANMATKVYKVLGSGAVSRIEENPYILTDIDGISFKTADSIAYARGVAKNNPNRIKAGVKYILTNAAYSSGHTYMPRLLMLEHCAYTLGVDEDEVSNALTELLLSKDIFFDNIENNEVCYLSNFYFDEMILAKKLIEMTKYKQMYTMSCEEVDDIIKVIEKNDGIKLAPEQRDAVISSIECAVMVLTGGPGTGKTTTINTIIKVMEELELNIVLAAPTGRAAKRMSDVTGLEAKTIHRLLKMTSPDGSDRQAFEYNESNLLEADVIIVDEMSMVDLNLMCCLVKAIKPGARLILSGDADQLPSVGAGNVLRDIISSGAVPVTKLGRIFRQAEESLIVVNAHRINSGEYPVITQKDNDFFFLSRPNVTNIVPTVAELCKTRLPKSYDVDPITDIQVLSPMKKGSAGVINLNAVLQSEINPFSKSKQEYKYGNTIFREGDKVMHIRNDYDLTWEKENSSEIGSGVFNGDMGVIREINIKSKYMSVVFDDGRIVDYEFSRLDEIDLAYAITVHKSQGSEFPIVVMPVYQCAPMLMCRNLFYTAVTRAKDMVILVGDERAIHNMVDNNTERERYSGLDERLVRIRDAMSHNPFEDTDSF